MNNKTHSAPHIRHSESTRTLMIDVILALSFIYIMAYYYYGPRVLILMLISVATTFVCDLVCVVISRNKVNIRDLSAVVTGLLIPLLLPANVDYSVIIIAAVFAISVAKHPFGGVGNNIFNPVAAGIAFVTICFSDKLFMYPVPLENPPIVGKVTEALVNSPAFTLELGGIPKLDFVEMALGNFPGPMGATNILVILACLLYLIFRNTVRWQLPVFFYITVIVYAWFFPRLGSGLGIELSAEVRLQSVLFEMMSGVILFGGIFLLGDPVTTPKRGAAKVSFAIAAGIVVMLFRSYGNLEEEFVFAVLLMNATVWGFDMLGEKFASFVRRRNFENISGKALQKKA